MKKRIKEDRNLGVTGEAFSGISQPFPAHFHQELVIGLILSGSRLLRIRGQEILLGPGSLFLIPARTSHECLCKKTEPTAWLTLRLSSDWNPDRLVLHRTSLNPLFAGFHKELMEGRAQCTGLHQVLETLKQTAGTTQETVPAAQQVSRILALMETDCRQRLTLQDFSQAASCSPSTLQHSFEQTLGVSVHRALESVRLEQARRCLESGASLAETADQCGFADQAHLTNVFTRFMGITPKNWIRQKGGPVMKEKVVIVVRDDLPAGVKANAAAILAASYGKDRPDLIGPDVPSREGIFLRGILSIPVPILQSSRKRLEQLMEQTPYVFTDTARHSRTYEEYMQNQAMEPADPVAVLLTGPYRQIQKQTGDLPLMK